MKAFDVIPGEEDFFKSLIHMSDRSKSISARPSIRVSRNSEVVSKVSSGQPTPSVPLSPSKSPPSDFFASLISKVGISLYCDHGNRIRSLFHERV